MWTLSSTIACTVCGGGGQNQQAFIDTMVFMTVTPLMLLGGAAGFVFWRYRQTLQAAQTERPRIVRGAPSRANTTEGTTPG